jgi:integrase
VTPTRGGMTIAPCKTKGSHRTITLDEDTAAALEEHRGRQLAEREAAGEAYQDQDLIFCDEVGRPINPQRLTERFAALREKAGIRPGRLHDVRHSHATLLLTGDPKAEVPATPLHVVSSRLGHATCTRTSSQPLTSMPPTRQVAHSRLHGVCGTPLTRMVERRT